MKRNFHILINGYKNIFNINSRATRREFWLVLTFTWLLALTIAFFLPFNENVDANLERISLAFFVIIVLAGIRRNHDVGYSGFWLMIPFMYLIILVAKSEEKENRWGPVPKDIVYDKEIKSKTYNKFSIFKYFLIPKKKDWLFLSLIGSIYVTLFMGTTLLFWWFLFFGIRVYLVNKKIGDANSKDLLFVSYSTEDQLIVSKIKDQLLSSHNIDSWWQNDLSPSEDYKEVILNKINSSSGAIIMYSENFENSTPIQEWELDAIKAKKSDSPDYLLTVCIVGKHDKEKIPFSETIQIVPSRSESLSRLTTEDLNREIEKLSSGLKSFINIREGVGMGTYKDPRWFSFIGIFFMIGNFVYDSGLGYFIDRNYYDTLPN